MRRLRVFSGFSLSPESSRGAEWLLMAYSGRKQTPKYILSPLPPLGTGHMRFKIPSPKGLSTLRTFLTGESAGLGSKGAFENTAVCKQSWDCDIAEGVSTHLC